MHSSNITHLHLEQVETCLSFNFLATFTLTNQQYALVPKTMENGCKALNIGLRMFLLHSYHYPLSLPLTFLKAYIISYLPHLLFSISFNLYWNQLSI